MTDRCTAATPGHFMGYQDREYYRDQPQGIVLGGPRMMVTNLVLLNCGLFVFDRFFAEGRLSQTLGAYASLFESPWNAWQLVTYAFVHSPSGLGHIFFNMLALWFFGREVEQLHGRREVLSLYLTAAIFAGLVWVVAERLIFKNATAGPLVGASGAVCAIGIVYIMHFPMRTFHLMGILPVPAWLLGVMYLLSNLMGFQDSLRGRFDNVAYTAHLAGLACGLVYFKTRWSLIRLLPNQWKLRLPGLSPGPKLRVYSSPADGPEDLEDQVDRLLEKIHNQGEASLTRAERRLLEEASRRFQKRRQ